MIALWFLLTSLRVYWIKKMASVPAAPMQNTSRCLPVPHLTILNNAMGQMNAPTVVKWINRIYWTDCFQNTQVASII